MTTNFSDESNKIKNTILIVDDDKIILQALTLILGDEYILHVARTGEEAIDIAKRTLPDLILLDVIMSDMSGFDVISVLKNSPETAEVPIIFITGMNSRDDEARGLALGASDYINKPFTRSIVKLRVGNQLKIVNQIRLIQRMSVTDTLTGVANRRQFNTWMDQEWRRAARFENHISVLIVDIDFFKVFNDTHGHLEGDMALKTVAEVMSGALKRSRDLVARWGGEEFALILPDTDMAGAVLVGEVMRKAIEKKVILYKDDAPVHITASIGVHSVIPDKRDSIEGFISEADKALYEAKRSGRNRVVSTDML